MFKVITPIELAEWLVELAEATGKSMDRIGVRGLDRNDFPDQVLDIHLPDGSKARFLNALCVESHERDEMAVFTREGAGAIFPRRRAIVCVRPAMPTGFAM